MSEPDPVVVVGAGPVGLTLALGLVRRGVPVRVIEQRRRLPRDLRATTLQPPTLGMLAALGVLEAVEARGLQVQRIQLWDWEHHELLASLPFAHIADQTSHPYRVHCAQHELCDVLYEAVETAAPGTVRLDSACTGFVERGDGIEVHVQDGDDTEVLSASWLCGCDGARSTVRQKLGVDLRTYAGPDVFLTCETGLEVDDALERAAGVRIGPASFLFTHRGWALFMRLPTSVRWLFLADGGGPDAMTQQALEALTHALVPHGEVELRNRALYPVRQQLVDRWRVGRAVLLGDAAHSTFPVAGTGMNSGMHDAFALSGALPDGAIDAWEASRAAVIRQRVHAQAGTALSAVQAGGWLSRIARASNARRLAADPAAAREHLLRASMLDDRA
ncbi:MAG: FAD-dependent monooxygenase [Alphaproteobacteria bacterium]|nr:FAD-dependent monooxygenase [Alphaproteobacteria bacterium]